MRDNQQSVFMTLWTFLEELRPAFALNNLFGLFQSSTLTVLYFYGLRFVLTIWRDKYPLEKLFILGSSFTVVFTVFSQTATFVLLIVTSDRSRKKYIDPVKQWVFIVLKASPRTLLLTYCFVTILLVTMMATIFTLVIFPSWLPLTVVFCIVCWLLITCSYSLSFAAICDGANIVEAVFFSIETILKNPLKMLFQFFTIFAIVFILFSSIVLFVVLHFSIYFTWTFSECRESPEFVNKASIFRRLGATWFPFVNFMSKTSHMKTKSFENLDVQMLMFVTLLSTIFLNLIAFLLQKAVYIVYTGEQLVKPTK